MDESTPSMDKPPLRKLNNLGLKMLLRTFDANGMTSPSGRKASEIFDLTLTERDIAAFNALKEEPDQPGMVRVSLSTGFAATTELLQTQNAIDRATQILDGHTKKAEPALPSAFLFELLVPVALSGDFLANLEIVYSEKWLTRYGKRQANMLWHSQCARMAARHWVDRITETFTAIRKIIW
ncbi:hypothetical protein [Pararhizobium arenae]|uniref:hypothetical protein n=1 Tax=Pararhizobium arenae TaxID=1856850 RepID=UPI00094B012F|nr:hypothetical protein [Pararhizobium arenae]